MNLPKTDNVLYADFPNAYWCIEGIVFSSMGGVPHVRFEFSAYASREAKYKNLAPIEATLSHGGPTGIAYNPRLHYWEAVFPAADLFPDGIPLTESEQRMILYDFIKVYLQLEDYEDVFEEGQNG